MADTNNKTNDFELDIDTPTTSEFMTYCSEKANMVYKYSDADSLLEHPEILVSMINHHRQNQVPRLHSLDHYYKAENDTIMHRPARKEEGKADYRIANNFGKVISSFMVGYMGGNPIQVQDKKDDRVQNVITEANDTNNADEENSNLLLDLSKYGRAYEILWRDEQDNNRFALSSVFDTFVIYDTTIEEKPIMAVRYPSLGFETDGRTMCQPIVYTADKVITYSPCSSSEISLINPQEELHSFGDVPVIEFKNNRFRRGDYEDVIPLIDAYDAAESDTSNYMYDFNDAMLWINGDWTMNGMSADDMIRLKKANILATTDATSPQGTRYPTTAQYLYKQYDVNGTEAHKKRLVDDIHKISCVPDLNDMNFGGNQTGESLKYKLLGLDQVVGIKSRMFEKGLLRRYKLILSLSNTVQELSQVDSSDIEITFNYNLPKAINDDLTAYIGAGGRISEQTLMALFPELIANPDAEMKAVKDEEPAMNFMSQEETTQQQEESKAKQEMKQDD